MELKEKILEILEKNRGIAVSGGGLAKELGVSRSAVWKCIENLREEGYEISAVTNRGYVLSENSDSLSAQGINAVLGQSRYIISTSPSVTSTNDLLKEQAHKGAAEYTVLAAEEQTAGKGRLGRRFESPARSGLYISIILRPDMKAEDSLYITTSAAVAVARAIDEIKGEPGISRIKWVNDIYIGDKKVCGILTEAAIDFETGQLEYAVLGIGVNLFPSEELEKNVGSKAGSVFDSPGPDVFNARNILAAKILKELDRSLAPENFSSNIEEYKKRSYLDGKRVVISRGNEEFEGLVLGIDHKARLVVKDNNGQEQVISSGEVSRVILPQLKGEDTPDR